MEVNFWQFVLGLH